MKNVLLQTLRYAVIVAAVSSAIYALILARASQLFQQNTAVSVTAAARLQPHNSAYLNRLANWQPDNRRRLLQQSAENPFEYDAWIRLGLLAEMQDGDNAAAEKDYLKAAAVNHMFLPRWTLANFYFRQQNIPEFFRWSKATLEITPYASDPVFAQLWQMTQDEDTLNAAIPDRPRILLQYVWYLSNSKKFDAIPSVVHRLVHAVGNDDPGKWGRDDLLAVSLDHMLAEGHTHAALNAWSALQDAGWIHETVPNDLRPLTNGDFRQQFYGHGFDWVNNQNPGTRVERYPDTCEVHISFYGDEPEHMTLLQEYVAAAPGQPYEVTWQAEGDDLSTPSGLAWHLHPVGSSDPEAVSGDVMAQDASWNFVSPKNARAYLFTLEYTRPAGTTRARGSVVLKSVAMNRK